jgi:hypothetical protein
VPDIESLTSLLGALTPIVAIAATVWISTNVSRSQKKFDRETELLADIREACATYVELTLRLAWQAKALRNREDLELFFAAPDYQKVRSAYQYILMFNTDTKIREVIERMSALDDARSAIVRKAIAQDLAPITPASGCWDDYQTAEKAFKDFLPEFYTTIRHRMQHHTSQVKGSDKTSR